ncbi:MAG: hypothetical protein ACJ8F7_08290 [Gemmataceae bacterium]
MHFQFEVAGQGAAQSVTPDALPVTNDTADLLRQMLDIQREQLQLQRHLAAVQDAGGRWRAFMSRWKDDYAGVPAACKQILPHLERAYIGLISDLTEALRQAEDSPLDNDFTQGEFLDRFGLRLNQLAGILNMVSPLADLAPAEEVK